MGVQDIIKDGMEDAPAHNVFVDDVSDPEDIPVADIVYSDASSDTELSEDESDSSVDGVISSLSVDTNHEDENICPSDSYLHYCSSIESAPANDIINEPRPILAEAPAHVSEKASTTQHRSPKNGCGKSRQAVGKKKARRIENARQLEQLRGDDVGDCDINDFMPIDCSFRFTQILNDIDLTNKVLNPPVDCYGDNFDIPETNARMRVKHDNTSKRKKLSPHAAFNNLYASEKDLLRRRNLPMGMVQYLDACVLSFFEANPTGTYVSEPLSSFERLMLHSIAHFYELKSFSFNADDYHCRLTKVTNTFEYFEPPCLCLSEYVERLTVKGMNSNSRKCKRFRRK